MRDRDVRQCALLPWLGVVAGLWVLKNHTSRPDSLFLSLTTGRRIGSPWK